MTDPLHVTNGSGLSRVGPGQYRGSPVVPDSGRALTVPLLRSLVTVFAALLTGALLIPAGAGAHAERPTSFPDDTLGSVPKYRPSGDGPSIVVCKGHSAKRINSLYKGPKLRRQRAAKLALVRQCRFRNIQQA